MNVVRISCAFATLISLIFISPAAALSSAIELRSVYRGVQTRTAFEGSTPIQDTDEMNGDHNGTFDEAVVSAVDHNRMVGAFAHARQKSRFIHASPEHLRFTGTFDVTAEFLVLDMPANPDDLDDYIRTAFALATVSIDIDATRDLVWAIRGQLNEGYGEGALELYADGDLLWQYGSRDAFETTFLIPAGRQHVDFTLIAFPFDLTIGFEDRAALSANLVIDVHTLPEPSTAVLTLASAAVLALRRGRRMLDDAAA